MDASSIFRIKVSQPKIVICRLIDLEKTLSYDLARLAQYFLLFEEVSWERPFISNRYPPQISLVMAYVVGLRMDLSSMSLVSIRLGSMDLYMDLNMSLNSMGISDFHGFVVSFVLPETSRDRARCHAKLNFESKTVRQR